MHMQHPLCPGAFVQIIDILRHDQQFTGKLPVQPRQCLMRRIWLRLLDRLAPHIVETQHQIGIAGEALRRCDILDLVLLPQPAARTECIDPAFGADSGSC